MDDIDNLFVKTYEFTIDPEWYLPNLSYVYKEPLWQNEETALLKSNLNGIKSMLNDKGLDWSKHTANTHKGGLVLEYVKRIAKPVFVTQAWCKFYEILNNFNIIPSKAQTFHSFHLCEAPGAFISALSYYIAMKKLDISWKWFANALNPYYEDNNIKFVIVDDRLVFPTLNNWYFGKSNTGDITSPEFLDDVETFLEYPINLITADGSFSCLDNPGEQEKIVSGLQLTEILIALRNLASGGNFVIKKYTFFECNTICQMYMLNCLFKKVFVFKPITSKAGNSEVYVICLGYYGREKCLPLLEKLKHSSSKAIFPRHLLPKSFISQIIECSKMFVELQTSAILENINLYSSSTKEQLLHLDKIRHKCAYMFVEKYCVTYVEDSITKILLDSSKRVSHSAYGYNTKGLRFQMFQAMDDPYEKLQKAKTMSHKEFLLDMEKRVETCFPLETKRKNSTEELHQVDKKILGRMKSKSYWNWIRVGKKIGSIQNSKFCNPLLLYLWNNVTRELSAADHLLTSGLYWDFHLIECELRRGLAVKKCLIEVVHDMPSKVDHVYCAIKELVENIIAYSWTFETLEHQSSPGIDKIVFLNATQSFTLLNEELSMRRPLVSMLHKIIKALNKGDTLILCLESILTRYTAGIVFMLISLFEKFSSLVPNDRCPGKSCQIWLLCDFQMSPWTQRLLDHLERILNIKLEEEDDILEVVPIASLCNGPFLCHVWNANYNHLLNRLRTVLRVELLKAQLKNHCIQ